VTYAGLTTSLKDQMGPACQATGETVLACYHVTANLDDKPMTNDQAVGSQARILASDLGLFVGVAGFEPTASSSRPARGSANDGLFFELVMVG
jgi:hypothetical protein